MATSGEFLVAAVNVNPGDPPVSPDPLQCLVQRPRGGLTRNSPAEADKAVLEAMIDLLRVVYARGRASLASLRAQRHPVDPGQIHGSDRLL